MGILRGGLLVIVSVTLFLSIIIATTFVVLSTSLSYENIHEELVPVISEVLSQQMNLEDVSSEKLALMQEYCVNQTEFVFSEGGETFKVPCSIIGENKSSIIDEMVSEKIDEIYYAEYDCGFVDCFDEEGEIPYFLISAHARDYLESKFYLFVFVSLVLAIGVFLLVQNKSNAPLIIGVLLLVSSLGFLRLDKFVEIFNGKDMLRFFGFLFTSSYYIAIRGIIIAGGIIALGLIFKFFKIGFWFSGLMSKFGTDKSKEPVKPLEKKEKISAPEAGKKKNK